MFIMGIFSWWYVDGWKRRLAQSRERLGALTDYFSLKLLIATLFSPYRQISASQVSGPLGLQWRAFVDRTISRLVGFVVRSTLVLVGSVAITLTVMVEILYIAVWGIVPLLPIGGLVMMFGGWVPTW